MNVQECHLCLQQMVNPMILRCCQNYTCQGCVGQWFRANGTCPFCRTENPDLTNLEEEVKTRPILLTPETRYDKLLQVVREGKKILIFSTNEKTFATIYDFLQNDNGIKCGLVVGQASSRAKVIESYTNGDTKVLILESRANGAGLNLQVTTDVIFFNSMADNLIKQNIGRANRIGIKHELKVHYLFPKDQLVKSNQEMATKLKKVPKPKAARRIPFAGMDDE